MVADIVTGKVVRVGLGSAFTPLTFGPKVSSALGGVVAVEEISAGADCCSGVEVAEEVEVGVIII
jgi:hypothetical protein